MKTKSNMNQKSEAQQVGTKTRSLPYINYKERETNRHLPTAYIMASLARWMPLQHEIAKVVRGVISIQFKQVPIQRVRQELSEMGFTWNQKRNAWQHNGGRANA